MESDYRLFGTEVKSAKAVLKLSLRMIRETVVSWRKIPNTHMNRQFALSIGVSQNIFKSVQNTFVGTVCKMCHVL